jgi:HSP90 family molecular chaperone
LPVYYEEGYLLATEFHESVSDTLENLIEQFSDVYCFYRELIQNSLDAGTNRVDIYLEFKQSDLPNKDGVMIIHVDDYGEGMNRDIIDSQLTKLFSSSKEGDQTKIGKFGIGFVSVFAIKPDAVSIDTSRDGEDWRILFAKDKTFKRLKRDFPVDGTKIQILKTCNQKFFNIFKEKSRQTVEFWCKHSEAEIYFEGEQINLPFDVDSPLKVHIKENSDEVVAGYTRNRTPYYGFYNQGLTLMEGSKTFIPFVTFKIKSKYLEHTLTRDNIMEDENYFKAMDFLSNIVVTKLPQRLFKTIETELLSSEEETQIYKDILWFAMLYLVDSSILNKECLDAKLARDTEGSFLTVSDFLNLKSAGCFFFDTQSNPVTRIFKRDKKRVIKTTVNSELYKQLVNLSQSFWNKKNLFKVSESFFVTEIEDTRAIGQTKKDLISAIDHINRKMGTKTETPKFANFNYSDSCIADRVYVMQENPGALCSTTDLEKKGKNITGLFKLFSKSKTLVLNSSHPYINSVLKLADRDNNLAAYLLAKLLYLDDGIDNRVDARLASIALERRNK